MRNTVCVAIESFSYKCKTKQGLRQCTRSLYRLQIEYVTPLVMFFCLWLFFDISSGIHFRVTHTELQAYTLKNTTHGSRHALQANSSNCCYKFSPSYLYPASSTKVHVPICHVALAELSRKQQCASGRWLSINPLSVLCYSVDADAPGSEAGASVDPTGGYTCVPVTHSRGLGPDHFDSQIYGHILLPGHQRPRRPKLQHSQSILRKQAEEEAIKRSRSLSESYELSSDLQDKQVRQETADTTRGKVTGTHRHMYAAFRFLWSVFKCVWQKLI